MLAKKKFNVWAPLELKTQGANYEVSFMQI